MISIIDLCFFAAVWLICAQATDFLIKYLLRDYVGVISEGIFYDTKYIVVRGAGVWPLVWLTYFPISLFLLIPSIKLDFMKEVKNGGFGYKFVKRYAELDLAQTIEQVQSILKDNKGLISIYDDYVEEIPHVVVQLFAGTTIPKDLPKSLNGYVIYVEHTKHQLRPFKS